MKNLAPIGVSTYSRLNHLKQTIETLQKNTLAKQSELYVFSDGPQKGDEEIVAKVREYIHTIDGFKKVYIVEREINGRVANNRGGIKQLLGKYGKIIWLEEDIVTAPGFLTYMNEALEFYKKDERVISISGYCPPFKFPKDYMEEVFLLQRFSAWGFATWKEKFDPFGFELDMHDIDGFFQDKKAIKDFKLNGENTYRMLLSEHKKEINALDVKIAYYVYKYNMYSLFPEKSFVQNIGHDGTGEHCGNTILFNHEKLQDKVDGFEFFDKVQPDEKIQMADRKFRAIQWRLKIRYKMVDFLEYLKIYPFIKKRRDAKT